MARDVVEVVVQLLDILAMIPLVVAQSEQSFLQDPILPVPKGDGEAEVLEIVRYPCNPVFAPTVGAEMGVVEGEVPPCVPPFPVVLSNGSPLTLADIGSLQFQWHLLGQIVQ